MSPRVSRIAFAPPTAKAEAIAGTCPGGAEDAEPQPGHGLIAQWGRRLLTDEALAARLQSGDGEALTEMFRRHSGPVFAIARRIVANSADAEDVTQRVFLDAFRTIAQFDPAKGAFRSWLLMLAYHRAFNLRRALAARRTGATEPVDDNLAIRMQPTGSTHGFSSAERRVLVQQALDLLPERQRRTIEWIYFGGLTADEVSARTGETVRVVRHNLYRGLEKIRKAMSESAGAARKGGRQ